MCELWMNYPCNMALPQTMSSTFPNQPKSQAITGHCYSVVIHNTCEEIGWADSKPTSIRAEQSQSSSLNPSIVSTQSLTPRWSSIVSSQQKTKARPQRVQILAPGNRAVCVVIPSNFRDVAVFVVAEFREVTLILHTSAVKYSAYFVSQARQDVLQSILHDERTVAFAQTCTVSLQCIELVLKLSKFDLLVYAQGCRAAANILRKLLRFQLTNNHLQFSSSASCCCCRHHVSRHLRLEMVGGHSVLPSNFPSAGFARQFTGALNGKVVWAGRFALSSVTGNHTEESNVCKASRVSYACAYDRKCASKTPSHPSLKVYSHADENVSRMHDSWLGTHGRRSLARPTSLRVYTSHIPSSGRKSSLQHRTPASQRDRRRSDASTTGEVNEVCPRGSMLSPKRCFNNSSVAATVAQTDSDAQQLTRRVILSPMKRRSLNTRPQNKNRFRTKS